MNVDSAEDKSPLSKSAKKRNKKKQKEEQQKSTNNQILQKEEIKTRSNGFDVNAFKEMNGESIQQVDKEMSDEWEEEFDVDAVLEKLLSIRSKVPGPNTMIDLDVDTIYALIDRAQRIIEKQPMLLRLKAPLTVGTDIHG